MAKKDIELEIEVPDGINVVIDNGEFTITGSKGTVKKRLVYPSIDSSFADKKIKMVSKSATKTDKAVIYAFNAHIKNAIKGVIENHVYKLNICSSHFPMTVTYANNMLTIKNFYGERVPRIVRIDSDVNVKVDAKQIILSGADKELVGQNAARIEISTRRPGFDKRIFQDGIYIIEKCGKEI